MQGLQYGPAKLAWSKSWERLIFENGLDRAQERSEIWDCTAGNLHGCVMVPEHFISNE